MNDCMLNRIKKHLFVGRTVIHGDSTSVQANVVCYPIQSINYFPDIKSKTTRPLSILWGVAVSERFENARSERLVNVVGQLELFAQMVQERHSEDSMIKEASQNIHRESICEFLTHLAKPLGSNLKLICSQFNLLRFKTGMTTEQLKEFEINVCLSSGGLQLVNTQCCVFNLHR